MFLAVNIGNSSIRFGVFDGEECSKTWTINTKPIKTEDELYIIFKVMYQNYDVALTDIEEIVIGSVVPNQTYPVRRALRALHNVIPVIVNKDTLSQITNTTSQMGTDLYANAVAAAELYEGKKIIVDFGTALTLTCIDENSKILGVIIGPGVNTSINSLVKETAQLPNIELKTPKTVLGMNTEACMQSGFVFGFLEMIEGLIRRINEEVNDNCYVIATGGLGHKFSPLSKEIKIYDRLHTIKGLRLLFLYQKNKKEE